VKNYTVNVFYSDEDEGYIADIPDLAVCSAFGATPAGALAELEQAKEA
jgi:predicted RNase H-like HicB family nuclease